MNRPGDSNTSESSNARGGGIVDRVKESATAQLSSQKERATDSLGTVANAVRQTTQSLREQQHDTVAQYIEQAADQIERFSERLKNKDVSELLNDAQQLARRQPALFIGGAFAIGLAGARFLKSSSPHADESQHLYGHGGGNEAYRSTSRGNVNRTSGSPQASTSRAGESYTGSNITGLGSTAGTGGSTSNVGGGSFGSTGGSGVAGTTGSTSAGSSGSGRTGSTAGSGTPSFDSTKGRSSERDR